MKHIYIHWVNTYPSKDSRRVPRWESISEVWVWVWEREGEQPQHTLWRPNDCVCLVGCFPLSVRLSPSVYPPSVCLYICLLSSWPEREKASVANTLPDSVHLSLNTSNIRVRARHNYQVVISSSSEACASNLISNGLLLITGLLPGTKYTITFKNSYFMPINVTSK